MAQAQKRQRRIAEAFDFKLPRKILRRIESLLPDDACDALASASNATSDINVGATTTPFGKLLQKVRLPLESGEEHEATCLHPAALLQRGFRCLYTKFCRVLKKRAAFGAAALGVYRAVATAQIFVLSDIESL